jgi:hypothetical protein
LKERESFLPFHGFFLSALGRPIQKRIIPSLHLAGKSLKSSEVDTPARRAEVWRGLFLRRRQDYFAVAFGWRG